MSDRSKLRDIAILKHGYLNRWQVPDINAIRYAQSLKRGEPRCSGLTGTWDETIYQNVADFTANANTSAETTMLAGTNDQPVIPALFWNYKNAYGRSLRIKAAGVLSTTSTPTIIFQVRLGTTSGSSYLSGTSIGVSATITTLSAVTNQLWVLEFFLTCRTPGQGSGNTTLSGWGSVTSGGGFASPFSYALLPTTPPTATWTATIDNTVTQYLNLSSTWGTASSSNTITCKSLTMEGMN
jgi:hypothetical protein